VEVETPPVDVETPPVDVDTPPVEVLTPPEVELDVELTPPVDVLTPPVDVLVEPPLVVDDTTTVPPLLLPPPKKPPKKPPLPPPQPPEPPANMVPLLPPDVLGISMIGARASGTGGDWVCTVMTVGATGASRRTTRRGGGGRCRTRGGGAAMGLRLTDWTWAGRAASAIWRAPPPMMAPPHAKPHNFAKAILTDMISHSFDS